MWIRDLSRRHRLRRHAASAAVLFLAAGAVSAQPAPADRFVTVNGLRIHYVEWGAPTARPMILLHGIGRIARTFDPVAAHFARNYRVLAVDMRGHGDSEWHPEGAYTVEDYTSDIAGLVEQLDLSGIVIWGNSTGGRVAQMFAGLAPDRVAAVIVEDVGPERPRAIANALAGRVEREDATGWASVEELYASLRAGGGRTSDDVLGAYARYGSKPRADGRIVWKRDPAIANDFVPLQHWRFIGRITAPIIYVLGGASSIVPPETQTELARLLPQVRIVTMPGLGHYPSEEDRDGFIGIVEEFLEASAVR